MSWLISRAMMEAYANSPSSPGMVAEYSEASCSGGEPSAPWSETPTAPDDSCSDKMKGTFHRSPFGMMRAIAFFMGRCKMGAWIKNTDMAKRATASSAESCSRQETKEANRSAARMLAVAFFKRGKPQGCAQSALKSLSHHALAMRHAQEHAVQSCGFHEERSTQWLMSGRGLPFSPVRSSQDVSETKQIERQCYLVTRLKSFAPTLRRTSSRVCRGTTTGKGLTNGA